MEIVAQSTGKSDVSQGQTKRLQIRHSDIAKSLFYLISKEYGCRVQTVGDKSVHENNAERILLRPISGALITH